ncbi:hypothetical protein V8G54_006199 [Vigna mungo]|uniref:Uncharacterized protein n=1 Tax=Vigna mungo TaxID=3915 RepID=A0AAQ3P1S0_VIGMU
MGFRLPSIRRSSFSGSQTFSCKDAEVPKGYLAVYVGEKMKRFLIPVLFLNEPLFQELLRQAEEKFGFCHPMGGLTIPCEETQLLSIAEEEFGFSHPMGGLTIPCTEDIFLNITSVFRMP